MSFYNQWRDNVNFKCTNCARSGDFQRRLLANEVDAFEFTQNCNMGGEYTRCFYKLKGIDIIYQETPCDEPRIQWKKVNDKLIRHYNSDQAAIWVYIRDHYIRTESAYQVRYERKTEEKI